MATTLVGDSDSLPVLDGVGAMDAWERQRQFVDHEIVPTTVGGSAMSLLRFCSPQQISHDNRHVASHRCCDKCSKPHF